MKNSKSVAIVLLVAVLCVCLAFAACTPETPTPTQLAAPQISLDNATGTVSWSKVEHADSYDVKVNSDAPINVTAIRYVFPADTAEGTYDVTVTAKSSDTQNFSASVASNKVTYTVSVVLNAALELNTQSVKTVYYLDEGATEPDYSGLVVKARYSDTSTKTLTLSELTVDDDNVDLTTTGNKKIDLSYQEDGVTATASFYIAVRERTIDDVTYTERTVEHDASGKYNLGEYSTARTMNGASVLNADGTVNLPWGKTLVRLNDDFVLVTVLKSISTAEEFRAIADDMEGYYVLVKDIDFENAYLIPIGTIPLETNSNNEMIVSATGGTDAGQIGVAFTGTLDGQGYTLKNYKFGCDDAWRNATSRGLALFGWLGANGVIKNVNIASADVRGAGFCSFLVGYNQGTITNVCVDASCAMYNHYSSQLSGAVAAYNDGAVDKAVSYVATYTCRKGADNTQVLPYYVVNPGTSEYKQGAGTIANDFLCDVTDLTATLGAGWTYFDGLGTRLTNPDWVYIANTDTQLPFGMRWYLNSVFMNGDEVTVSIYDDNGKADQFTAGWDGERHSHYVEWKDISTATTVVGDVIKVVLHSNNWKSDCAANLTISAAVVKDHQAATASLQVVEGLELALSDVQIREIYSDGTGQIIAPIKLEGFDAQGEIGTPQSVKAFYGTGENDFVTVTVTITAKSVVSIVANTASSYKTEYETDETLDVAGMKIDVRYNNQTSATIDVAQDMIEASSYDMSTAGNYNVLVRYGEQTCTFPISVRAKGIVITSIEISGTPAKVTYKIDEAVALADLNGVELIANGDDDSHTPVEITLAMLSYDFSTAGNKQITVTYAEQTATIDVTVVDFVVELVATPTDTTHTIPQIAYDVASTPDVLSAATYKAVYKSGAEADLTTGVTTTEATTGKQTVTYTYDCADGKFTAEVEYEIWAEIDSVADWQKINDNLAGYYRLTSNLSFGGTTYTATKSPNDLPHSGSNYCMIGESAIYKWPGSSASCDPTIMHDNPNYTDVHAEAVPFTGIFDGNGFYIHSLTIDGGSNSSNRGGMGLALFGTVGAGAKVGNFTLKNIAVKAQSAAAFVAVVNFGTVENVVVESTCSILNKGNNETAGLVCYNAAGATARNLISYVDKMSKTKSGVVSEFDAQCVFQNKAEATAENCCIKGSAEFAALTADALGAGWTVIDNYGPVYGHYAVVTKCDVSSVALNGSFTFEFALADGIEGITVDARVPKNTSGTGSIYQTVTMQGNVATVTIVSADEANTMQMTAGETYTFRIRLGTGIYNAGLYSFDVTITA